MEQMHRVVIIGGGFGGLYAARALKHAPVQVTLIDRRNFHLFQPLLYQVATGALSPANIAAPLRAILKRQKNCEVLLGEVTGFDAIEQQVLLKDGARIPYDSLIVATGARHNYFGNTQWETLAPGLKTVEDATEIRKRILLAFETAERESDPAKRRAWMTFIIVGGGATGVELAGAVAEIAHHTLKDNFRHINPAEACIILVEGSERVLTPYIPRLSQKAATSLEKLGVTVRINTMVTSIQPDAVMVKDAAGKEEHIPARTVLWAAGVQGSPLGRLLAEATGAHLDRVGRVMIEPDLTLPGHPHIFVIGDLSHFTHQTGKPLPGVAQVAMQQGAYAARLIRGRLMGAEKPPPFHYLDLGSMATIGRKLAVAEINGFKFDGLLAWLAWLFIHLMNLVAFDNRLLVFVQWAWNYFTRNRSARLITGENQLPMLQAEQPELLKEQTGH